MNKRIIVFILVLASSLTMMSTDLYAPSLAHLPEYFGTSVASVKLTMSLNILAYALATLVHGPLSERFGRRPVLLWGLLGFTFFSLCCALAQTIEQLIIARVFQGICAAVEGVLVLAIIRDIFDEKDQVRVIALYGVATAVTPAVAPVLGGYIHVFFGWRMNFHLLFVFGLLVTVAIWYYLQESSQKAMGALSPRHVLGEYGRLLRNGGFMKYSIIAGCSLGVFFAFITAGPFILIRNHGMPTQHFGFFWAILVIGFVIGAFIANRMVRYTTIRNILNAGVSVMVLGALAMLGITSNANDTITNLAVVMFIIAMADGPIFATTPTLAMQASDTSTGAAAAMLVTIQMSIAALASLGVAVLHDDSARPLGLTIAALVSCSVLSYSLNIKKTGAVCPP